MKPISFLLVCFIAATTFAAEDAHTPAPPAEQPPVEHELVRYDYRNIHVTSVHLYVKPTREDVSIRVLCVLRHKDGSAVGRFQLEATELPDGDRPLRYSARCMNRDYAAESLMFVTVTDNKTGKSITTLKLPFKDATPAERKKE